MTITLTVHTNQEAYDAVKAHLSGMPKRAVNAEGDCLYCTDDGLRCAVGALLDCTDDEARELYDFDVLRLAARAYGDCRVYVDFGAVDVGLLKVGAVDVGLLKDLQRVHDDRGNWTDDGFVGHGVLRSIAERWELTP